MDALTLDARGAALDFDGWLSQRPAGIRDAINGHLSGAPDREAEKKRLAASLWISEQTGVSPYEVDRNFDTLRAGIGERMQWDDDWQDTDRFHARIVKEATKERDEKWIVEGKEDDPATTGASLVGQARAAAFEGRPWAEALGGWVEANKGSNGFSPDRVGEYSRIARETYEGLATDLGAARPAAAAAWAAMEAGDDAAALAAFKPLSPEQRALAAHLVKRQGESESGDRPDSSLGEATGKGFARAADRLFLGAGRSARLSDLLNARGRFVAGAMVSADARSAIDEIDAERIAVALARSSSGPGSGGAGYARAVEEKRALTEAEAAEWNRQIESEIEDAEITEELRGLAESSVDPITGGSWVRRKLWQPAIESAPTMLAAAVPGAWAPLAETAARAYQLDEYTRLRGEGIEQGEAMRLGGISGGAQGALDVMGWKWLQKFAPKSVRQLMRFKVAPGSSVGRAAGLFAAGAAGETAVEQIQDQLIPAFVDDFISNDPRLDRNWGEVWKEVATTAPDVFLGMVLPTAFFAAAGARGDMRAARELMGANEVGLRVAGYTPEAAAEIVAAKTPEQVRDLLNRNAPVEAPTPEKRAEVVGQIIDEMKAARDEAARQAEAERAALAADNISLARRGGKWVVSDGKTEVEAETAVDARQIAASMSDAVMDYDAAQVEQLSANMEAVESLEASQPEGQKSDTILFPQKLVTALDKMAEGGGSADAIIERQRIFEEQRGLKPGESAGLIVLGENAGAMREAVYEDVSKINAGGTVLDVFEERIEGRMKAALERGIMSREEAAGVLAAVEAATGDRYVTGTTDADLIEGVSSLLRAELYRRRKGTGREALAPAGLVTRSLTAAARAQSGAARTGAVKALSFIRAARVYLGELIKRAWSLKKARAEGKIGEDVDAFIGRLVGVGEQAGHNKAVMQAVGVTVDQLATSTVKAKRNVDLAAFRANVRAQAAAAAPAPAMDPADEWEMNRTEEPPDAAAVAESERYIQGFLDFNKVPEPKQEVAKPALAAAGIGLPPAPVRLGFAPPDPAEVAKEREGALQAWFGVTDKNATPEQKEAARAMLAKGPVSSLLHKFVTREIPAFDIRGARVASARDFHQLALAARSPFFESVKLIVVDENDVVVGSQITNVGSINESVADVRAFVAIAVGYAERHKGSKVKGLIISHNHPSGITQPSNADVELTRRLETAARNAGIPLLDHVVTNGETFFSFAENGMVSPKLGKVTVPKNKGKADLPAGPVVADGPLAPWETIERKSLPEAGSTMTFPEVAKITQTADPDHVHLYFLNNQLRVMAVERVEPKNVAEAATRGVGREGALTVMLSLPAGKTFNDYGVMIEQVKRAAREGNFRVGDVMQFSSAWLGSSARDKGFMEPAPLYDAGRAAESEAPEYGMAHRPMTDEGGAARLHDLVPAFGEDVYGRNALQYFGSGDSREAEVLRILAGLRGKPDAKVTIFRGVPAGAPGTINRGDWVTLSRGVAEDFAELSGGGQVLEMEVKASEVTSWADSLLEFGYYPEAGTSTTFSVTPAMDAEYLAAVERRDLATAQRMVDEAAKAAGYTVGPVWHGTPDGRFLKEDPVFRSQKARFGWGRETGVHWFASRQATAASYADDRRAFDYQNAEPAVVRAFLRLDNPVTVDGRGKQWRDAQARGKTSDVIEAALAAGNDGVVIDNVQDDYQTGAKGRTALTSTFAVFDPTRIKSADPVTFGPDGKPVPLSARFDPTDERMTFSLGSADMLESVAAAVQSRSLPPKRRREIFDAAQRELRALASVIRHNDSLDGNLDSRVAIERERITRQEAREAELTGEIEAEAGGLLSNPDLARSQGGPLVSLFLRKKPGSKFFRGVIMSKSAARKAGKDLEGEFDGAEGLPSWLFGGGVTPDSAVDEAVEAGFLPVGSKVDALWDALRAELAGAESNRKQMRAVEDRLRAARKQARDESRAWAKEQLDRLPAVQKALGKKEMLRGLAALDALLARFPIEVRARVGGFTRMAAIETTKGREAYLRNRVARLDVELEKYLRQEYAAQLKRLIDRSKLKKGGEDRPGEKPIGRLGADAHVLMKAVERAMMMDDAAKLADLARLDSLIAGGTLTPEQEALAERERELVNLVGGWSNLDAASRSTAVAAVEDTVENGWLDWQKKLIERKERREVKRGRLMVDVGMLGSPEERQARAERDLGWRGQAKEWALSLSSFEEVVTYVFGKDSKEGRAMVDAERAASNQYEDAVQAMGDRVQDLFTQLGGGSVLEGERIRYRLSQPTVKTGNGWGTLSELETIQALLMWAQEDGQRHMLEYRINAQWIRDAAAQLTPNGIAVMQFIQSVYGSEHAELNRLYRERHGVDLPRHDNYAPLTVKPIQAKAGEVVDPVSGQAMTGNLLTPGSLRTRSRIAAAEPDFRDALQTMLGHTKQMEHWKAYYDFAVEANSVLGNRNLGNSVKAKAGNEAESVLRKWVDLFASGGHRDAAASLAGNRSLNRIGGRFARMALVGRAGTLLIQSTQLAASLAEMPTGAYVSRFGRLFAGRLGWADAIRSPFIQRRFKQAPPIVRQAMESLADDRPNVVKHAAARLGTLISGADALFTAGTYAILLDYHRSVGGAAGLVGADLDAYAHREAERATERVAQPTRLGTRSLYENTTTNPLARLSWGFASEARQKIALAAWAVPSAKKDPARAARVAAVVWGAGGLMASLIRSAWRDMRDDEDDEVFDERNWGLARLVTGTVGGPLYGVPMLGEAIEGTLGAVTGAYVPEGGPMSSLARSWPAVQRLATLEFTEADDSISELVRDVEAVMTAVGLFNETTASATTLVHPVRDAINLIENWLP